MKSLKWPDRVFLFSFFSSSGSVELVESAVCQAHTRTCANTPAVSSRLSCTYFWHTRYLQYGVGDFLEVFFLSLSQVCGLSDANMGYEVFLQGLINIDSDKMKNIYFHLWEVIKCLPSPADSSCLSLCLVTCQVTFMTKWHSNHWKRLDCLPWHVWGCSEGYKVWRCLQLGWHLWLQDTHSSRNFKEMTKLSETVSLCEKLPNLSKIF